MEAKTINFWTKKIFIQKMEYIPVRLACYHLLYNIEKNYLFLSFVTHPTSAEINNS
jgi:hypothetical protein